MNIKNICALLLLTTSMHLSAMDKTKLNHTLFKAIENYDSKQVEKLINSGANVNITNEDNLTPLYRATANLYNPNNMASNAVTKTQGAQAFRIVKLLLDAKANPNIGKANPLHPVIWKGNKEVVKLLLSYKANIDRKSDISTFMGLTPIEWATYEKQCDIAKLLVDSKFK